MSTARDLPPDHPRRILIAAIARYFPTRAELIEARKRVGWDEGRWSRFMSGAESNVTLETLWAVAKALEIDPAELVSSRPYGEPRHGSYTLVSDTPPAEELIGVSEGGEMMLSAWKSADQWTQAFQNVPVVPVPKLATPVAAGSPILGSGDIESVSFFSTAFVSLFMAGPVLPGRLVMVEVAKRWLGESMLDTIRPGATLAVDRGQRLDGPTSFENGAIYLVRHEGGITCKRVWLTGDTLNCHADNRGHPPIVIRLEGRGFDHIKPHLAGKVVRIANPVDV